jgi:hypothetical protein
MCFTVHKIISKLEYVILTTLYLIGVKNTDNSFPLVTSYVSSHLSHVLFVGDDLLFCDL